MWGSPVRIMWRRIGLTEVQESKEEGRKRDRERIKEVREELPHHLVHKATGPPPVCRVRTLYAWEAKDKTELSFKPGSINTKGWPSETNEEWLIGTLKGKKGYMSPNFVMILD